MQRWLAKGRKNAGCLGVLGILEIVAGFYFVIRTGVCLATLTLVAAMVPFTDGVTRVIVAFKMNPVKSWGWMLAGGIVSVLSAVLVGWEFPASSLWVIGTLAGFSLIFHGFTKITLAGAARYATGDLQKATA